MTGPGDEQYPIGNEVENFLLSLGTSEDDMSEPQPSPEDIEFAQQRQRAEGEVRGVFWRYGFTLEVPEGETLLDVSISITEKIDALSAELQTHDAGGETEQLESDIDEKHATFETEYTKLMKQGEPYYIAGKLALYIAARTEEQVSNTGLAAEVMAALDASDYFNDEEKQRLHEAIHEVLGEADYTAAQAYGAREGLGVQKAAEYESDSARGAADSEQLHNILFALKAMGTNAAHEEWQSLAQDLQRIHMTQQRIGTNLEGLLADTYVNLFNNQVAVVRLKASRVGVNETQLRALFTMLGIEAVN